MNYYHPATLEHIRNPLPAVAEWAPATAITAPDYDSASQQCRFIDGAWAVTSEDMAAQEADRIAAMISANTESLWQAAHNYEYAQVSGSAIGMIAMGVLQGKPKCLAVQNWIKTIWELYYTRKPLISAVPDADLLDFSNCGNIPYTVPELMAELGL